MAQNVVIANNVHLAVAPPDEYQPNTAGVALPAGFRLLQSNIDCANLPVGTMLGFMVEDGYTVGGVTTWSDDDGATFSTADITDFNDNPATVFQQTTNLPQAPYPDRIRVRVYRCSAAGRVSLSATLS